MCTRGRPLPCSTSATHRGAHAALPKLRGLRAHGPVPLDLVGFACVLEGPLLELPRDSARLGRVPDQPAS
eukprot:2491744-Alexandrium_andersonii.AAC.1